jgi:hypothetical protein
MINSKFDKISSTCYPRIYGDKDKEYTLNNVMMLYVIKILNLTQ